jgi:hypothetical protein
MTTIVTAYLTDINHNPERNTDIYLNRGCKILSMDTPCVCFIEKHIYDLHIDPRLYPQTHFIMFDKHDNYLYEYLEQITEFKVFGNEQKDTLDYMFLQCYKTEFVRQAILLDSFKTSNFVWVDFGIGHMMSDDDLCNGIKHVSKRTHDDLRIGNADNIPLDKTFNVDLYRRVMFYFLGSVFGGHKNSLIEFADRMKKKCIAIIETKRHIMWEVNIWYLLYKDNPDIFNPYKANHDMRILHNY